MKKKETSSIQVDAGLLVSGNWEVEMMVEPLGYNSSGCGEDDITSKPGQDSQTGFRGMKTPQADGIRKPITIKQQMYLTYDHHIFCIVHFGSAQV